MDNAISIMACTNVFNFKQDRQIVPAGMNIAEIVDFISPHKSFVKHAHVQVGPEYIPEEMWGRVRPRPGAYLTVRFIPAKGGGGGGKNPLGTILSLALAVALPGLGTALASAVGFGGFWIGSTFLTGGTIFSAVLGVVGNLAISALAPPPKPKTNDFSAGSAASPASNPTLFISGAQNQTLPWGRVPYPLGKVRMVPPMMLPYTETVGADQYLRMLFIWGFGPMTIGQLKIGETDLSQFTGVEIETRQGFLNDAPITLYSNSVIQDNLSIAFAQTDGYVQRTTEVNADEISVDLTFGQGLVYIQTTGHYLTRTVQVSVGYSLRGANSWTDQTFTYTASQTSALVENVRFVVPRGQYDVRVKRLTVDVILAEQNIWYDRVSWTALRTVRYTAPVNLPGVAMTALRIKATGQLNGVINQFNGVVQSIVPTWSGSAWDDANDQSTWHASSNPAALYRHVLKGPGNKKALADSRVNSTDLSTWYASNATNSREYNYVIAADMAVQDVLQQVAACGRAAPALIDGKWTIVEDKVKTTPTQHFTPRNSWGFSGKKAYPDLPHAFRVQFSNRNNGWLQDERIVYDDGYNSSNATLFEALPLTGITSSDQAWKDGRYHIATARLRPELYTFYADYEHIACTRGDLIKFTHDVPLFGVQSARVKSVTTSGGNITQVTLDEHIPMLAGSSYGMRFRKSDGTSVQSNLINDPSNPTTVSLVTPIATASGPAAGDLAMFGLAGQETVDMVVKSIEPANELTALITVVDYAPAVYTSDAGSIPTFNSQITSPQEFAKPPAPVASSVQLDDGVLVYQSDGTFKPSVVISLAAPGYPYPLYPIAYIKQTGETDFQRAAFTTPNNQVIITGVNSGDIYDIKLIYDNVTGVSSDPLILAGQHIVGGTLLPSDPTNFNANIYSGVAHLSWDPPADVSVLYWTIKFNSLTSGVTWANSFEMIAKVPRTATTAIVPALPGTYLIKSVNANGESENEDTVISTIAVNNNLNVVETFTEDPAFSGTFDHTAFLDGFLQLGGSDAVDDWPSFDAVVNVDIGNAGLASSGYYYFANSLDLGDVFTTTLTPIIAVDGEDVSFKIDDWSIVDDILDWDGVASPLSWSIQLEVRTTNDDPLGSPVWSEWQKFVVSEYTARAMQFRVALMSNVTFVTPIISQLEVIANMPTRTDSQLGLVSALTDVTATNVTFLKAFKELLDVQITAQNMASSDYFTLSNQTPTGFSIAFFNASNARVTRNFNTTSVGVGVAS